MVFLYCQVGKYNSIVLLVFEVNIMLNSRIRELRIARNMSQVELARRLGVTKQSVSNWENDNIMPSVELLVRIATVFGVSTDYLLGRDDAEMLKVSGLPPKFIAHLRQLIEDFSEMQAK